MGVRVVLSFGNSIVTEFALEKPVVVVGRHPDCDIVIDHPAISVRHMLFRIMGTTVFAEDLASTNGTKINGLVAYHQVVHHLDLIELGLHKLHFYDDALLVGGVSDLESTVHTEHERTMMEAHVKPPPIPAPPPPRRGDDDLSRTVSIGAHVPAPPGPVMRPGARIALQVRSGVGQGQVIVLDKANTMIGPAGGDNALVVKRGAALYLMRFSGHNAPRMNGAELGPGTHPIAPQDVIDVGGSSFQVIEIE